MKTSLGCIAGLLFLGTGCTTQVIMMDDSDCGLGFYGGDDGCLYWHQSSVTFHFTNSANSVHPSLVQAVRDAAATWNMYISSPQIVIAGNLVNRQVNSDGVNIIHFATSWDPSRSNVQGTTYIAAGDRILETDIEFNMVNFVYSIGAEPFKVDMRSLALHELGHALGLVHSESFSSVMYPALAYNYNRQCPYQGDVAKALNVYSAFDPLPSVRANGYFGWGQADSICGI